MAAQTTTLMSVEEYLRQERLSLERHEYFRGEMLLMESGTATHSQIAGNLACHLGLQLRDRDCVVRGSDMRLRTSPSGLYSYADVIVSCGDEEIFEDDTLLNPLVIAEVLSASTENYDRGLKFQQYRQIPSFREYLIVAQDRPYVEHHIREEPDGVTSWRMQEYTALQDVLTLKAIGVQTSLAEIYRKALRNVPE